VMSRLRGHKYEGAGDRLGVETVYIEVTPV
jgi:hypothetical protein